MQGFFDFMKSLGAARMAAMAAVTLALIGFFSFLMVQMTTPQMVPLFTDLSVDDSASIIKDLERQAVPYQIKNDGAIIMVPKDKVARLRMKLAEVGPAERRRSRLRDFRQDRLARRDDASSRTSIICARWKASSPARSAASTACRRRACIWCCRNGRCSRVTRSRRPPRSCSRCAGRSSRSRCAPSATWSPAPSTA